MKAFLLKSWDRLSASFWFIPALMAVGSILAAVGTLYADDRADWSQTGWILTYTGGTDGARAVLTTVAGSMITIAGVVFSLTLVALTLASSQFGPRLLRNFMSDTANQVVLGTFIATFLYCLAVLRAIRDPAETGFLPQISVSIGVLLAMASLGVLIYFIHHVSTTIQADVLVARVASELDRQVDGLFPSQMGVGAATAGEEPEPESPFAGRRPHRASASRDGYVQIIDAQGLMDVAVRCDLVVRLEVQPGQYVTEGQGLAEVWAVEEIDEGVLQRINGAFVLGVQRTTTQDVTHAVHQLVEVAVRALSPGVNDPFTAIACVDRLGSALVRLVRRAVPSPYRFDEQGRVRVVTGQVRFPQVLEEAFGQIRHYGRSNYVVTARMLAVLAGVAQWATGPEDRQAIRRQADQLLMGARQALTDPYDIEAVEEEHRAALGALEANHTTVPEREQPRSAE